MRELVSIALLLSMLMPSFAQEESKGSFNIYGHVMTDAGYNFHQANPDFFDVMRPSQLPTYENQYGVDGNLFYSVRQTMLGIEVVQPTKKGDLKIDFLFDLFGVGSNTGQTAFHMLVAYAEIGKVGVGHNWSLFCDIGCYPNIIEYWGPVGLSLCKAVQFRYIPIQGRNRLAIALENPGATADEGKYVRYFEMDDVEPKFNLPDLSAEFRMTRKWGYAELAGIIRKIEWVDKGEDAFEISGTAIGWGLHFSSNININKNNMLISNVVVGEAIQSLMNDGPTDIALQRTNNIEAPLKGVALPITSFSLYLNHKWNKEFTSAIGYSAVFTDNTSGQKADAFKKGEYASTNLLYHPTSNISGGVELQWIRRKNYQDGAILDDNLIESAGALRVQFSVKYRFGHRFI
ncbi:DcaP family trimeric outer membrane transporter [Carboxylicivirga marina]|uniref:Porin n=1 Tax=Carboxylicivirga marina TaxID=2800988 RepID=A0ABS1HHD3_9BACT|nr:DcaP family trimeric outer membrane transporter [Carboxylicivirga marina]MBK3517071.1 hypothetical protein [Carboxylicivirga marina]